MEENSATGRRYDREFKQNAVELVRAGRTVSSVASFRASASSAKLRR